ncbi:GNAT family N-acetyltransferase [Sphingomonas sp. G-3-2-10]|uniref:GNAT family N-acetyltransferase n=1 Tax=Sphingomonas sp. G-3-2-10 TaxID=2728838 RepID=UPI00146CCD5E|nr:GNAT family N-acetyltransferase [Sphingomonas sp. G-3-2-10]NML07027.1 GNAT family N-acetyltransferase [Sphingomonas sp. G-3-2-10]
MEIREGGLRDPRTIALLELHAAGMLASSPAESCHFLDLSGLETPDVTFWTAWDGEALLGMGAMKQIDAGHGEIKSMRTAPEHLGKGVGAAILERIMATARERSLSRLSLETGSSAEFDAAHALYRKFGFTYCDAFGDYPADDPFSRFMTRQL